MAVPGRTADGAVGVAPSSVTDLRTFESQFRAWLDENASALDPYREHHGGSLEDEILRSSELQRLLWDEGWTRVGWPEDCGGLGGTALFRAALYEGLFSAGFMLPEVFSVVEVIGPCLVAFGRPLAQRHLSRFLRGDEVWCQGFSEPGAGSDLAAIRTRAIADGATLRISGQKVWSSFGATSDRCLLLVRSSDGETGHRGLSMLLVDLDTAGVSRVPTRAATGRDEFAEIFFDDVVVPNDRVVGEPGQGWEIAMRLLQWERGMYAWQRHAYLHRRLKDLVRSLPGDAAPAVAEKIGNAYLALYALRSASRRTVRVLAEGGNPGPEISVDKILLGTTEQLVFDTIRNARFPSIELGDDFMAGALRSEYFYTRAASIYGGSAEIQRNIVAERMLNLPREKSG